MVVAQGCGPLRFALSGIAQPAFGRGRLEP
jgi:hypothetical protein